MAEKIIIPPMTLTRMNYGKIEDLMAYPDWELESFDTTGTGPDDAPIYFRSRFEYDLSLGRQLARLVLQNEENKVPGAPDLLLFASKSAIPVIDAVKGFYESAGLEAPRSSYVRASHADSRRAKSTGAGEKHATRNRNRHRAEVERLEELCHGSNHVCVVDQFVSTGTVIKYATELLHEAGAQSTSVVQGYWYQNWTPLRGKLRAEQQLTSTHRRFMYRVGRTAYERSLAPTAK